MDLGPILIQDGLEVLTLTTYAKILIQIKPHSEVPSGHYSTYHRLVLFQLQRQGKTRLQEIQPPESQKREDTACHVSGGALCWDSQPPALAVRASQVMCCQL